MSDDAERFGNPRVPDETITSRSHLFHLAALPPTTYDGGTQQQAHQGNFPILTGQDARCSQPCSVFPQTHSRGSRGSTARASC
jgi:hypothetical protein